MRLKNTLVLIISVAVLLSTSSGFANENIKQCRDYQEVIQKTANMVSDSDIVELVNEYGLTILDLTWEDTGRYKNSAVGPNISDMTIQVQHRNPGERLYSLACMPVIRHPNFSDKTADIPLDKFYILAGNENGEKLKKVRLKEFLGNIREYLHNPDSWKGPAKSLLANRDTHALVSAQACFLPVPKQGKAEFNPVLFNYQSYEENPAVLAIIATREGTSVTIIDNKRDGFQSGYSWGQRLFFNQNGQRASLTGERLADFTDKDENQTYAERTAEENQDLNMVLLIQVPLKQRIRTRTYEPYYQKSVCESSQAVSLMDNKSDMENAVIGHGKVQGPFTEIADLEIERDPAFPIRVTVQFYKATSNGIVSQKNIREISEQINKVYDNADYAGSLVTAGATGRPTEYIGDKIRPPDWWEQFWKRHLGKTGQTNPGQTHTSWGIIEPEIK